MSQVLGPQETSTESRVEEAYDRFAPIAERVWGPDLHYGYWSGPEDDTPLEQAMQRLTGIVIGKLGVGPGCRVLDVGCGNGRPSVAVARDTGADVVAIDINRAGLSAGATYAYAEGVADQVSFEYADVLATEFEDERFDAALVQETSPHFSLGPLLGEVGRLVRPGGRVVLETPYLRVPPTEELERRMAAYLELIQASSLDTLDRHLEVARASGLEPSEFVDITEYVSQTWPRVVRRLQEHWSEIEEQLGGDLAEYAFRTVSEWCEVPEIGAMTLTLRRSTLPDLSG